MSGNPIRGETLGDPLAAVDGGDQFFSFGFRAGRIDEFPNDLVIRSHLDDPPRTRDSDQGIPIRQSLERAAAVAVELVFGSAGWMLPELGPIFDRKLEST